MGKFVKASVPVLLTIRNSISSRIILSLLSTGEAYIIDLRSTYRGRFELCDEDEGDERARYGTLFQFFSAVWMTYADSRGFLPKIDVPVYDLTCFAYI